MRAIIRATVVCITLFAGMPSWAQHGHPLVGSWSGHWQPEGAPSERLLLVLEYDNDRLSGVIFFGTQRIRFTRAALDPASWTVRFTAQDEDDDGNAIDYLVEGGIENLGSTTDRAIAGRLSRGSQTGEFRVVMN